MATGMTARRRAVVWLAALVSGVLLGGGAGRSQESAGQATRPAFRSGVDLVSLHVTVTDARQGYVTGLQREDFTILEDGRPQEVAFFGTSEVPLALAVLIDSSASMSGNMTTVQEAATGFVRAMSPRDVASIIEFDTRAQLSTAFTNDRATLEQAIQLTWPDGATALYDAVYIALKELEKLRAGRAADEVLRPALVILSDGADTSSVVKFDDLMELARRSGAAIYTIGIGLTTPGGQRAGPLDADFVLRRLAQETGGRAFFPQQVTELTDVYQEIVKELGSQYVLGYASTNARRDGAWRRISVKLRRKDAIARTKPGYYAPRR
jgi:Ca-activated chloride channel family protein